MKTYENWTLGQLISALKDLGDEPVRGLSGEVYSYRGFYERNCTYSGTLAKAQLLASMYESRIGGVMVGWKGGYYTVRADQLIYFADEGCCGPVIVGLEPAE